jgi:hypothetical protein
MEIVNVIWKELEKAITANIMFINGKNNTK